MDWCRCAVVLGVWVGMASTVIGAQPTRDTLETVKKNLESKKAILLDVRELKEWQDGHLLQAGHLPLSQLRKGMSPEKLDAIAPQGTIIYLYCAAGARCQLAADYLPEGRYDVRPLGPGYRDLLKAGFSKAR